MILSILQVLPLSWVGEIPTVFFEIAAVIASGSINPSFPISTGTGVPPAVTIAEAVAVIVCELMITSSPFLSPIASQANSSPSVALPTPTANFELV